MSRRSARHVFQGSTSTDRRLLGPVKVSVLPPFPRLLCVGRRQTSYGLNEALIALIPLHATPSATATDSSGGAAPALIEMYPAPGPQAPRNCAIDAVRVAFILRPQQRGWPATAVPHEAHVV